VSAPELSPAERAKVEEFETAPYPYPHEDGEGHTFEYDEHGRKRCECGTYLFEHAPDHPYRASAGPKATHCRCLREDCDWAETRYHR
jgi:hypothetical protein